ncbi:hypothetical protein DRP44_03970 [candidate division TA06 bacterium]|uniref:Type II secretion system protein GspG C-terminal domain-containing protein n=1 Tax=candidate division TA06 bacterium TaxID=2250710 RepID=A0A660SAR4_UNCT6|nr:MAG: hypothetical protein DRP44_03970 [candidate division TA06 bacterium]
MKKFIIIFLIVLSFVSCSKKTEETYTKTIPNLPKKAKVLSDLVKLRTSLNSYKIQHNDSLPSSLSDFKLELYYKTDEYYVENGTVKSKHFPSL